MSSSPGFDWLRLPQLSPGQPHTPPPPPVSFGSPAKNGAVQALATQDQDVVSDPQPVTSVPEIDFKNLFAGLDRAHLSQSQAAPAAAPTTQASLTRPPLPHSSTSSLASSSSSIASIDPSKEKENQEILRSFKDNTAIPLSLTVEELTTKETKTYLRWYNDIVTRRGTRTITLQDVFRFLRNFKIQELHKKLIHKIFQSCANSLNIGQFFCLLRIISHSIVSGTLPSRELIKKVSNVPAPVSILSRKRQKDTLDVSDEDIETVPGTPARQESDSKLNLDTFAQFMLTGKRPQSPAPSLAPTSALKSKKSNNKKVKFSEFVEIEPDNAPAVPALDISSVDGGAGGSSALPLDLSLPMEQLLGKVPHTVNQGVTIPSFSPHENEEEELKDMQESISHFQNVTIDSVSIDGVPANIPSQYFGSQQQRDDSDSPSPQPLQPNLTGSVSKSMRQGLGLVSPPPPPPRLRASSSPLPPWPHHQQLPLQQLLPSPLQQLLSSPRVLSPLANTSINWLPAVSAMNGTNGSASSSIKSPPPLPPRARSSTVPSNTNGGAQIAAPPPNSRAGLMPPPPPPRFRKNSNTSSPLIGSPLIGSPLVDSPALGSPHNPPPTIEVNGVLSKPIMGFDDYFKNGEVHKSSHEGSGIGTPVSYTSASGSRNTSNDILSDLKALQQEVDRIKQMSGTNGY